MVLSCYRDLQLEIPPGAADAVEPLWPWIVGDQGKGTTTINVTRLSKEAVAPPGDKKTGIFMRWPELWAEGNGRTQGRD